MTYPWGKARSLDTGAGPVGRPMTGLNAGSIPAPGAPRCTHPNLFGLKGHCVWCGEQVGELRLVRSDQPSEEHSNDR